ncbi:ArpU family phage packaging/lysis transcriptional regulator [Paenibacillus sp. FJAT-26967]|uniref:ArpU family phage packaging/lysis transcriptional regulator n=1 Tax=Paenibacillus sp. FJAT-26967 TaxID=1729690 RepID=UPI0008387611|nr:ArpU family phage packaging/lysis transcriptional regulator [Paenibacillus sp. FJAT-26967]
MQQAFDLPELDRKLTKLAVEDALMKYRICKYVTFEEREASITAGYTERPSGPTNVTSDQTANIAIYNADEPERRRRYCERIERAVRRLPQQERFLVEERYMTNESDYITDQSVYSFKFDPPISHPKYGDIRWRAFYALAMLLNIAVKKDVVEGDEIIGRS